jgi:hypothetical protein
MRFRLVTGLIFLINIVFSLAPALAEKRAALVIGNSRQFNSLEKMRYELVPAEDLSGNCVMTDALFSAKATPPFARKISKIDRSMSIVAETEQVSSRGNFAATSKVEFFDGLGGGF